MYKVDGLICKIAPIDYVISNSLRSLGSNFARQAKWSLFSVSPALRSLGVEEVEMTIKYFKIQEASK